MLEPWGEDYTVLPRHSLEFRQQDADEGFYWGFHMVDVDGEGPCGQLYVEGSRGAWVRVFEDGSEVRCSFNRAHSRLTFLRRLL